METNSGNCSYSKTLHFQMNAKICNKSKLSIYNLKYPFHSSFVHVTFVFDSYAYNTKWTNKWYAWIRWLGTISFYCFISSIPFWKCEFIRINSRGLNTVGHSSIDLLWIYMEITLNWSKAPDKGNNNNTSRSQFAYFWAAHKFIQRNETDCFVNLDLEFHSMNYTHIFIQSKNTQRQTDGHKQASWDSFTGLRCREQRIHYNGRYFRLKPKYWWILVIIDGREYA